MDDLLVSIVMAVKNAEQFLLQAMHSIAAQQYQNYEIIIVDGRSTDATRTIAQSNPRAQIINQPGKGFANAWNLGIDAARGDVIAFLDSDDLWPPDSLARRVERFHHDPRIDCVIGRVKFFLEEGQSIPRGFKPNLLNGTHIGYMPGTSMLRRRVFDTMGKFEEHWQIANDLAWFARLRHSALTIDIVDDVLLQKRIHSSNLSNIAATMPTYREEVLKLAKQSVAFHRALRSPKSII